MTSFNMEVDYWTLVIARIFQASGLAFLFIPISTVAYVGIPREKNNNASAIINLARNLGGSIGIAVLTTILARREQYHRNILVDHIAAGDWRYESTAAQMAQHMAAKLGGSAQQAMHVAQAQIQMMVDRQAQMLSYIDDFMLLAILFAGVIPFLYFMRKPPSAHGGGPGGGAH